MIVFPIQYWATTLAIAEIATLCLVVQLSYILAEYNLFYLGIRKRFNHSKIKIFRNMTYAQFLRWEQVGLNVVLFLYFILGILLDGEETCMVL